MTRDAIRNSAMVAAASEGRVSVSRRAAMRALVAVTAMPLGLSFARPASAEARVAGFVFTADERGNAISRIDLERGKVDTVPVQIMPHNVQFVPGKNLLLAVGMPVPEKKKEESHRSATTQEHGDSGHGGEGHGGSVGAGQLIVFDAADFLSEPRASIRVGHHPAHVIADVQGNHAYVTNSEDNTVSVINLDKGAAAVAVTTGHYPHGLRMSPDGRSIYVANTEDGSVSVIDTAPLTEVARIKVGAAPVQVGFTPDGSRVYVSLRDDDKVAVIDTATRAVAARIAVGRSPIQVYATPDGRYVYVANQGTESNPDDTVSVIDTTRGRVVKTIRTGVGAHGVVVSDDGAFVFVTNTVDGTVAEIAVESQSVARTYRVGKGPNGITYQGA